jgi:CelD/BcsL family acetyltransferase involved in cellulose biosynthesis
MKRAWLAEKGLVSPALADPRTLAFFRSVAADTTRETGTRVSALTVDGAIAAVEIAFRCRERMVIHIMAYDLAFEKAAVGVLLLEHLLAKSHEDGIGIYDLMAPGDGYKKEWADGAVVVCDYAVPLTLSGRAYVDGYLARARPALKAAFAKVPVAWKRWALARLAA